MKIFDPLLDESFNVIKYLVKVVQKVKYRNVAGEEMPEVQERSEINGQN